MRSRTDEERERVHGILTQQFARVGRMLADLLGVSGPTEEKIELHKQPVALRAILTAAEDVVRPACDAHHQKLTVKLPREPIYLEADTSRMEQVFGKLFGDASQCGGEGAHITVTADRDPNADAPQVVVRVRDEGKGDGPDISQRSSAPPIPANPASARAAGGLKLTQRLVTLHGGSIETVGEGSGRGTETIVRLPILELGEPFLPPIRPLRVKSGRRILIVDDNVDSTQSMASLQKRRGHDVRTAGDGPEALAIAAEFLPEVVLLDIGLPGMDGLEVARRLRAMPALSRAFLVAMTGYASEDDRRLAKEAGFDEHLIKPVDLNILRTWLGDEARFSR